MPYTPNNYKTQPTRVEVLERAYEALIDAARRNRRCAQVILDTRIMSAGIDNKTDRWCITVKMPAHNTDAAMVIERAIRAAIYGATTSFT